MHTLTISFTILRGGIFLTQPITATSSCFNCEKPQQLTLKMTRQRPASASAGPRHPIIKTTPCCDKTGINEPDIDVAQGLDSHSN